MAAAEEVVGRIVNLEAKVNELPQRETQTAQRLQELTDHVNRGQLRGGYAAQTINHFRACIAMKSFARAEYKDWRLTVRRTVNGILKGVLSIMDWAESADEASPRTSSICSVSETS
eukprot:262056-Lingulodinium_polyedra.AAC.1